MRIAKDVKCVLEIVQDKKENFHFGLFYDPIGAQIQILHHQFFDESDKFFFLLVFFHFFMNISKHFGLFIFIDYRMLFKIVYTDARKS